MENKQLWLWKPMYIRSMIEQTMQHMEAFTSVQVATIRETEYDLNVPKQTQGKDKTLWDVQTVVIILLLPDKPTPESATHVVETWAKHIQEMGVHPKFNDMYKAVAQTYANVDGPTRMMKSITINKDHLTHCFKNCGMEPFRRMHLDHTFMDDTIKRIMETCYSHNAPKDWDQRAKQFAFKDGNPENRF